MATIWFPFWQRWQLCAALKCVLMRSSRNYGRVQIGQTSCVEHFSCKATVNCGFQNVKSCVQAKAGPFPFLTWETLYLEPFRFVVAPASSVLHQLLNH